MRTLFIGSTRRGYLTLKALIESQAEIVGVISLQQDAHETDRYEEPIRQLALSANVPIFETKLMRDRDYDELIRHELQADLAIAVGIRVLVTSDVYAAPKHGTVAVHDSLIPEYRGFAPVNWALINGLKETGVTLFFLNEQMDGGDVVDQIRVPIGDEDTAPDLYEKICNATVEVVLRNYPALATQQHKRVPQDYSEGSFTCSRIPSDGMIDWAASTSSIYNLVRALTFPYPGAFTFYRNQRLFVWEAHPVHPSPRYEGRIPGRVVGYSKQDGWVDVLTGDGIIRLVRVQLEGGEIVPASDVISSVKVSLGLNLFELWQRLQTLEALRLERIH